MTAAEILRDALTQYAQQTLGRDRALANELADCADHLAAAHTLAACGWQADDILKAIRTAALTA